LGFINLHGFILLVKSGINTSITKTCLIALLCAYCVDSVVKGKWCLMPISTIFQNSFVKCSWFAHVLHTPLRESLLRKVCKKNVTKFFLLPYTSKLDKFINLSSPFICMWLYTIFLSCSPLYTLWFSCSQRY